MLFNEVFYESIIFFILLFWKVELNEILKIKKEFEKKGENKRKIYLYLIVERCFEIV